MKNILAIHDISCAGRCSLTVALPVISGLGVTCTGLPTALLSTHTGGFTNFTCLDLTKEMKKIQAAWRPLGLKFDAVYSGFLASGEQIDIVKSLIEEYRKDGCIAVVDPVMADDGKLYSVFDDAFVGKMKELVPLADVLVPNMTEAMLLTGTGFREGPYTPEFIAEVIRKLLALGAKNVVLTGVFYDFAQLGAAVGTSGGEIQCRFQKKIAGSYHGTGDIFGSVLCAELVKGKPLAVAAAAAVDFVVASIEATPQGADFRYGVDFETVLHNKNSGRM